MENFIVSARKYRPGTFDEVVGQQHVTNTLANAIQQNHLAQALLFTGPRGVGKTTCARILARMINSEEKETTDQDFSFNIFELDAASNNSVDDIRNLIDQVRFAPQAGNYKVYIIDEVHMLSQAAFNAFLKTLEEPPRHAIFILATTEKHKIIPTILSRCQIYDFKRITVEDIASHLRSVADQEGIEAEGEALHIIAQKADGALRDALSIFDRIVSFSGKNITYKDVIDNLRILDYDYYFRTTDLILKNDQSGLLLIFNEILDNGFDGHLFINGLSSHFRDLMVCKDSRTLGLLEVGESTRERYKIQSRETELNFLLKSLNLFNECDVRYKGSNNPRLLVELALLRSCSLLHPEAEKKKPLSELSNTSASEKTSRPAIKPAGIAPPVKGNSTTENKESSHASVAETKSVPTVAESKPVQPSPEKERESPIAVEEESRPSRLKRRIARDGLSISAVLQGNKKEEVVEETEDLSAPQSGLPKDDFNQNQLENLWNDYLLQLKKARRQRIFNSLDSARIQLTPRFVIEIELHSETQLSCFHEEKHNILKHLREKLNNFSLTFKENLSVQKADLEPYSPQEKFDYMVKKNPHLLLFKQKLDLDLE